MSLKGSNTTSDYLEFEVTNYNALKMIRSGNDIVLGFLVIVGINTGLKISDLLKLQYEDLENDSILIVDKKNKKKRIIRINDNIKQAFELLKSKLKKCEGHIFKTRLNTVYSIQYINRWLNKQFGSKKKKISCHSMRKTMGRQVFKNCNESEKSLLYLSELFNHNSIKFTKKYLCIIQEEHEELDDVYMNL